MLTAHNVLMVLAIVFLALSVAGKLPDWPAILCLIIDGLVR